MHLKRGVRIGRPFGIPLLVHGSWFPAAALLVSHFVLTVYAELELATAVVVGVLSTLAFFACLVAHELGHALMARSIGIEVRDITLFVFGGMARIDREPSRAAQEFVIAIAGPIVSAALGVGLYIAAASVSGMLSDLLWTIAVANLALAVFNMFPGFPLDGGRVLRALLWARWGDPHRAQSAAARGGQAVGLALIAAGIALFITSGGTPTQGTAEGVWLAVVGVFLVVLATSSRRAAGTAGSLAAIEARMWARPFAGSVPIDGALGAIAGDGAGGPFAVSDDGRLAGVLLPQAIATASPALAARELMLPWTSALSIPASDPVTSALERLYGGGQRVVIVVDDDGAVVGFIDRPTARECLHADAGDGR